MTDKKNPAELYAQALDMHKDGLISSEQLEAIKKDALNKPVFKEDEQYLDELKKWSEIKKQGGISEEEFKNRQEKLMNPNKPSVNDPAPTPDTKKKKKKKGCGCLTMIILAGSILGVCSLYSCLAGSSNKAERANSGVKIAIRQAQAPKKMSAVQVVLQRSEPWRAEFTKKISGFDAQTQTSLQDGMSKLSAFNEWVVQDIQGKKYKSKGDTIAAERCEQNKRDLLAFMEAQDAKVPGAQKAIWKNAIGKVYSVLGNKIYKGEEAFNPQKAGDDMIRLVKAEQNRQKVQARVLDAQQASSK